MTQTVSLIVPAYNEAETLPEFCRRTLAVAAAVAPRRLEILFVNDGSTDSTGELLDRTAETEPRIKVLHLARNRGHQVALIAGMDFAAGDIIVTMDADLQDPPEVVPQLVAQIDAGHDIVHARRLRRQGETFVKLATAWIFYRFLRLLSGVPIVPDSGDFRAFTRPALEVARAFRAESAFIRGTFAMLGFRQTVLMYERERRYAGRTKYPVGKMVRLAVDAVLEFSAVPIRAIVLLSFALWALTLAYVARSLYLHFVLHATVPGWTSLLALTTFYTGLILLGIAVVGSYVGRTFLQVQRRPLYWLRGSRNITLTNLDSQLVPREVVLAQSALAKRPVRRPGDETRA